MLESIPSALDPHGHRVRYVFTRRGQRIKSIREIFTMVCRDAGLTDIVFHDSRHTATTTPRRAGVDALTAMKFTGHKTMAVFKRNNPIDEGVLAAAQRQMDTNLATMEASQQQKHQESIEE